MTKHIVLTLMGLLALKLFAAAPPEYESLKAVAEKSDIVITALPSGKEVQEITRGKTPG